MTLADSAWDHVGSLTFGGFLALALLLGLAIGSWVTWIVAVRKLRIEETRLAGDLLKDVEQRREGYNDACAQGGKPLDQLIRILRENKSPEERKNVAKELDSAREEFCAHLIEKMIPRFRSYADYEHHHCQGNSERIESLLEEVLHELSEFGRWLQIINHPNLLKIIERRPARITKLKLDPFKQLIYGVSPDKARQFNERVTSAIDKIVEAGK